MPRSSVKLGFFCVIFFLLAGFINSKLAKPPIKISKQESALNFQGEFLKFGFAGYKRLMADVLWITTLLESDLAHYKQKDLNSWMYLRFKSIIDLDPNFLRAYQYGGQFLSIIKDDLVGASAIFELGLNKFPNDYSLNFNAAYLYAFELQDYDRAVELYKNIKDYPQAPRFIDSLIARLEYAKTGDLPTAFEILKVIYENSKDDQLLKEKLEKDLYAVKATIDLRCLNQKKQGCSRRDFYGNPYILKDGIFAAQQPFTPYNLYKRRGAN